VGPAHLKRLGGHSPFLRFNGDHFISSISGRVIADLEGFSIALLYLFRTTYYSISIL